MHVLRFEGKARYLLEALRQFRSEAPGAGTVAGDHLNCRRFRQILQRATIASLRSEILGLPGGEPA